MFASTTKTHRIGTFALPSGRQFVGELSFAGQETFLKIHSADDFGEIPSTKFDINGILEDSTKVSLLDCIATGNTYGYKNGSPYFSASFFPHFAVAGGKHLASKGESVRAFTFTLSDVDKLFDDRKSFGLVVKPREIIEKLVQSSGYPMDASIGPNPVIFYFTGKQDILSVDTLLGKISATHKISYNSPGAKGFSLTSSTYIKIEFDKPLEFAEAFKRVYSFLIYASLLIGRRQLLIDSAADANNGSEQDKVLDIFWTMQPEAPKGDAPSSFDILVDAANEPAMFCELSKRWFDRQNDWQTVRRRFNETFEKPHSYSIDRLVASANIFDILPTTLGCLGKRTLTEKANCRAKHVTNVLSNCFPRLDKVIHQAVKCRNFYVHGGKPKIDYDSNFNSVIFLTDTLEFVLAASDLIEAGWDAKSWASRGTLMSHPFGRYLASYAQRLQEFESLIEQKIS